MGRIVEAVMGDLVRCTGPVEPAPEAPAPDPLSLHRRTLQKFQKMLPPLVRNSEEWKWYELLGFCETLVELLAVDTKPDPVS